MSQKLYYGQIINDRDNSKISGATIYNLNKNTGTVSNENGKFSIFANIGDVIQISYIGKHIVELTITDITEELNIKMINYQKKIKEVTITETVSPKFSILYNKDYESYQQKPKKTIFDHKTYFSNTANVLLSPISAIYYATNKKEQRRLLYLNKIYQREIANQIYNLDLISDVTKVTDEETLLDIRRHCYFSEEEILSKTTYQLMILIKSCYLDYQRWKHDKNQMIHLIKTKEEENKLLEKINDLNNHTLDSINSIEYEKRFK